MADSKVLKEEGNQLFTNGNYGDALACYTKALNLTSDASFERCTLLKNRAACFLKLEKYTEALSDSTGALEISCNDPKALYRRCQAFEQLGRTEEAYKDAAQILQLDPKNKAVQPILQRLNPIIQDKLGKQLSMDNKVNQMLDLMFKTGQDEDKRRQAANNLIVLAREEVGAEKIFRSDGVEKLVELLLVEKDHELQLTAIRILSSIASHTATLSNAVLMALTLKKICAYIGVDDISISTAMAHLLQTLISVITNLENIRKEKESHEAQRKANPGSRLRPYPFCSEKIDTVAVQTVDEVFNNLIPMLESRRVSCHGRDNIMELMIKFVTRQDGCGWSKKFILASGVQRLLTVAGIIRGHGMIAVTDNSRMHVSLCLSKIYNDLISDQERELFTNATDSYFTDMFTDEIMESKLSAILSLTALLQGPTVVGNSILSREGVLDLILAIANSDNAIHVKYAVEALIHSASKKEKCLGVIKQATPILKQLYHSQNEAVKVRALVGLCKLSSYGGGDASIKSFAEGSSKSLAKACRKFMCNPAKDVDLRKWAAEAYAYLTLDADCKEDLVHDTEAIRSLIDLAKVPDKGVLYPVAQIFVNVTNSYEKKEIEPEMLELAKYTQQHIPEEHEKDKESYVTERVKCLVKLGMINALVALSKTESESCRELLSRVFLAVCTDPEHRGLVVQQGGAKALIPLANESNDKGKTLAAHALAKLAVTQNPEFAFPGQRSCEVIRPLISLLGIDKTAIQNYEALMALTNLASMNDTIRKRILKEKGFSYIEQYCFEEHEELKRAAVECLCNMVQNDEVKEMFKGENDRVKLLVLYTGCDEDVKLIRAASGALAMLSHDTEICHKITTCTTQWFDILQRLAAHELPDLQHRGVFILANMMYADKEIAEKLVESSMFELLMVVSRQTEQSHQCFPIFF